MDFQIEDGESRNAGTLKGDDGMDVCVLMSPETVAQMSMFRWIIAGLLILIVVLVIVLISRPWHPTMNWTSAPAQTNIEFTAPQYDTPVINNYVEQPVIHVAPSSTEVIIANHVTDELTSSEETTTETTAETTTETTAETTN